MKSEQLYQHLTELAEKLGITVSEQNFRNTGIPIKSGLCKVHGKSIFVMNKHATVKEKIQFLSECLGQMPLDDLYVMPAVREVIDLHTPRPAP
jgi:hypothetical protein